MLALRLAWRYLIAKKSHNAVNVISIVSLAGVAVATAAIVVVLSVFNGFTELAANQLSRLDPDLLVADHADRPFADADSLARVISGLPGVEAAAATLTDRGLIVAGEHQLPVVFKGVPADYPGIVQVDSIFIDGAFATGYTMDERACSQLAVGIAGRLGNGPAAIFPELYVPRRLGRINPANPAASMSSVPLYVTGVVQLDQMDFDTDHIFIPLQAARDILAYDDDEASAIEIALAPGASVSDVRKHVEEIMGADFAVLTRDQQHPETFRMISLEKWVTFVMLSFILIIATFNIISTLSLMVIEKRDNMATFSFLGATSGFIRSIFMWLGFIITCIGGFCGTILGVVLSLAQQYGKFIRLNGDPSKLTIDVYPVHVEIADILAVAAIVIIVAIGASLITIIFTRRRDT